MAYPSLIRKILDLRRSVNESRDEDAKLCAAIAQLSACQVRLCGRLARLEIGESQENSEASNPCQLPFLDPSGSELACGARVAPVTMIEKEHNPHPGAALTVVLDTVTN